MWRTAATVSTFLNDDVRQLKLNFSKVLSGKKKNEPRWRECLDTVLESMPVATSALYVKNFFKRESRDAAVEMVEAIKEEFQSILKSVSWMDETTREAAMEKAKLMVTHIGYPDELMDDKRVEKYYKHLALDENKYFESILNISRFDEQKTLKGLLKPVNKSDWETHSYVAMINAFYNGGENSIRELMASRTHSVYIIHDVFAKHLRIPRRHSPRNFLQR
jgi:neprilysin